MDFELSGELGAFKERAREFAMREVAPHAAAFDRDHRFPTEVIRAAAAAGFLGTTIGKRYGGLELGNAGAAIVTEEFSRACASTGVTVSVHNSLVATPISRFGSDDLKQRYLPRLARGEWLGAYALTEPNAGSDAANQTTRAQQRGDVFVLDGTKLWITSGEQADVFLVFARTSLDDPRKKYKGITAFIVERTFPGVRPGKKEEKCGLRGSSTTELLLEGCEVPAANVLGEVGNGFSVAMDTLDGGRIGIASQAIGIADAALEAALDRARSEQRQGRPLGSYQAVQWKLAEMATDLEAARLLTRKAAWLRDRGESCSLAASMAKMFASTTANRACEQAVQIHGGAGYTTDFPVERFFRDARITEIYEGTTEVQHLVIAKHLLGAT
jgi:alkylation response protein AidB-like acyl-CoA dehydrogenase